ncbi:MAG: PepSY domain-containing protein [Candidatus Latescibacterota bacterium]|nr:PepSY domain-containing protein [Candidatus Latescibacterota bacterium]
MTLIKRIHMYTGLVNASTLIVFGLVGITASILPRSQDRPAPKAAVDFKHLHVPGDLDDHQLADHIQRELAIPLTSPTPNWTMHRDADNNLRFRLPTPARRYEITVYEANDRVRIRTQPFDTWQYFFELHTITPPRTGDDWRLQTWAWYVEISSWSLILMALTGIYLWLVSRPGYRERPSQNLWAQISLASGAVIIIAFYTIIR